MESLLRASHEYAAKLGGSSVYKIVTRTDSDGWRANFRLTKDGTQIVDLGFDLHNQIITNLHWDPTIKGLTDEMAGFVSILYAYVAGTLLERGDSGSITWLADNKCVVTSCELLGIVRVGDDFSAKPEELWQKSAEVLYTVYNKC